MTLTLEELRSIPYLDVAAIRRGNLNLMPYWDGERWHTWVPTHLGLMHLHPVETYISNYVAREPANLNDLLIPFVELMWQRLSTPETSSRISAISDDFRNLGTSIEKLDYFYGHADQVGVRAAEFVKTEVEYLLVLGRGVLDLLYEVIAHIWENDIRLLDAAAEKRRKQRKLPSRLSKLILSGDGITPAADIVARYAFPGSLAQAFEDVGPFFAATRRLRDGVVHLGKDISPLYCTERGFCLHKGHPAIASLPIWRPEHEYNANVVSVLPLLAFVVCGSIECCNRLALAFTREITFPSEVAPGYHVFSRAPHNEAILWMVSIAQGASPWWKDRAEWRRSRIQNRAYWLWETQTGTNWHDPVSNWLQAERDFATPGVPSSAA